MERDYYEILGISKDASRDEIKKAFHALAKKYHPDSNKNNPSAKRKFQEIRDAYEMRMSSGMAENAEYSSRDWDQFRYAHRAKFSDSFHKIFSEIFENESESLAADIEVELSLTFSEAAKGCTKQLSFEADVPCDSCSWIPDPSIMHYIIRLNASKHSNSIDELLCPNAQIDRGTNH
ncbi:UNVERIFIED_CONTAM: Chaperone protein dnaJ 1, mitochondrial [Sesamum latifolium]|uniref:Chaperone protein dnaJ 1, mitochondrial n=1 Tax=Sesamum latifolium TaxID=2727402 RepID=A0AAW2WH84_9LAMI